MLTQQWVQSRCEKNTHPCQRTRVMIDFNFVFGGYGGRKLVCMHVPDGCFFVTNRSGLLRCNVCVFYVRFLFHCGSKGCLAASGSARVPLHLHLLMRLLSPNGEALEFARERDMLCRWAAKGLQPTDAHAKLDCARRFRIGF